MGVFNIRGGGGFNIWGGIYFVLQGHTGLCRAGFMRARRCLGYEYVCVCTETHISTGRASLG